MNSSSTNTARDDDREYYPRPKRAPYLRDITDFGIHRPTSASLSSSSQGLSARHINFGSLTTGDGEIGWDLINEDGEAPQMTSGGLSGVGGLGTKSASSTSLTSPKLRRRSSFARVFSGMLSSPDPISEDGGGLGGGGAISNIASATADGAAGGILVSNMMSNNFRISHIHKAKFLHRIHLTQQMLCTLLPTCKNTATI